ncbi:portal protein [Massilia phyllosphaerae]|uniref:portal protein n=1 Tax=Massilia phyllosphaerae TaxID=3106034 RepID=UPI002B1CD4CC|nr:portal protein [Massilia sp. SGZ-792]
MSRPSKAERDRAKHDFFLRDFDKIQAATRDVRIQSLADRRFCWIPGAQWEGAVGEAFANKPRFELNKVALAVLRVINEYRNNRITVGFVAKDGSDEDELADTCAGLYRADEQASGGQNAYDNCFEEGTTGGMGAIRLMARYENENDDSDTRQRIAIKTVHEADSCVFFSLDGKEYDKSDARRCYLLISMTPDDYEKEFGHSPASWPKDITQSEYDWHTPDVVWVAEVYEIEEQTKLVHTFQGLALGDGEADTMEVSDQELQDDPDKRAELEATGFRLLRSKRVKVRKVHKWIMSGGGILSDEGYIAGTCIPIVPFYGKHMYIDGIERFQGHVRLARDAQTLVNMLHSWLAEMATRFDIEKPILTPEQIGEHATMWAQDAIEKYPYLLINPITDPVSQQQIIAPVAYTKAPNLPPAMAALAQLAGQALEDMLGNQQAGEQLQPNQSGKAVELIQQRLDMQVFIYIDNFKKTIKRLGEVWQSMAKDLLVEEGRRMKTVDHTDKKGMVELFKPMIDRKTGAHYLANDMSAANFDVEPDVGPSSVSRKAALVRQLIEILQMTQDPETVTVITSMILMNLEGEGMGDLRAFYRRKLVKMGVLEPTEEEKQQLEAEAQQAAQQPPSAQDQYFMAGAQNQAADAAKKQADTVLTAAKVEQTKAQTEKARADAIAALASIGDAQAAHALRVLQHTDGQALAREQMAQQQAQQAQPVGEQPAQ